MPESPLTRLRALAGSPDEQFEFALRVVERERNPDAVIAALAVLQEAEEERARPVLLGRYENCDRDGARRDPAGAIRIAILRALQPIAHPEDADLFARAASTYEHRFGEVASDLRAAGLVGLSAVDANLAGYYAIRLLYDPHMSRMSGEPSVSAARVLGAIGQPLPLYACVVRDSDLPGEVLGESLRGLKEIPAALVPSLIARYQDSRDEVVLLGLYDLLLEHPARAECAPVVRDFLRTTNLLDLYRSLIATLVAGRDPGWLEELQRMAAAEKHPAKAAILRDALPDRRRR